MRALRFILWLVLTITFVTAIATAHVGPSKDDNNRYLKLTPQRDRVRLAYTVFFGEVPGARMRPAIDTDRDGVISEREAQAFGDKLADEVAASLDLNLDNTQHEVVWDQIVVGMGSPQVRGGAFSVDLVALLCVGPGTTHELLLRDRFKLLSPGETEVKIEDTHGITNRIVKLGSTTDHVIKFVGPGGPLADDGVHLTFDVTDQAAAASSACAAVVRKDPTRVPATLVICVAALIAFALAAIVTWLRRRR